MLKELNKYISDWFRKIIEVDRDSDQIENLLYELVYAREGDEKILVPSAMFNLGKLDDD